MAVSIVMNYSKPEQYYMNTVYHKEETPTTPAPEEGIIYDGSSVVQQEVQAIYDGGEV